MSTFAPFTVAVIADSPVVAGPLITEPSLALKIEPWQGHWIWLFDTAATVQRWCVHTAVNALY